MASAAPSLRCSERSCLTGQDVATSGRKVVSDFFGRNKRQTKEIPPSVWHQSCRKHYQRSAYSAKTSGESTNRCNYYLAQLGHQLVRISLWRPEATFRVQLLKQAKGRLTTYHDTMRRNGGDVVQAKLAVAVPPKTNSKGESVPLGLAEAVEMGHAEHLDAHFCGANKTIDFVRTTILPWIETEISSGRMLQMPPIEFLLNDAAPGDTINDPATNYDRWVALCDGTTYNDPAAASPDASQSTPPTKKRTLKLYGPRTPTKKASETDAATSTEKRSGFKLFIDTKTNKARGSQSSETSSSASAGPSKKRKASDVDNEIDDTPSKKLATPEKKRGSIDDIPYYIPPAPLPPRSSSASTKKRPAPLDLSAISNLSSSDSKKPVDSGLPSLDQGPVSSTSSIDDGEWPDSAYNEIQTSSPVRAPSNGTIYAGAKTKRVLRHLLDEEERVTKKLRKQ